MQALMSVSAAHRQPGPPAAAPAELDFAGLVAISCGHTAFQLLWAAVELEVFTVLAARGPLPRQEIAETIGLQTQPARVLLQGLTALRLLCKTGDRYTNSAIADRLLVRNRPGSFIPLLGWQHHIVYKGMIDFMESLKENRNVGLRRFPGHGDTLYERLASAPEIEQVFQAAMSDHSNLHGARCILDIGGGDGTNAINLVRRFAQLRAVVFDLPTVCDRARRNIAATGLADRISIVSGHCFQDALPKDVDTILLAHMMTIWSPHKNVALLKKCHAALSPGGKVLVFNMISRDDDGGPLICALGSPYFQAIATGEGMLYSRQDYETWLQEAGFSSVEFTPLPMEHGLFTASKE